MSEPSRPVVYQSEMKLRQYSLWRSRYLVLFNDDVLSWYRSKQQFEQTQDQPIESLDLLEICSLTTESDRKICVHTASGHILHLKARDDKDATVWTAVLNEKQLKLQQRTDTLILEANKTVHPGCSVWEAYISASVHLLKSGSRTKTYTARPVDAADELHLIQIRTTSRHRAILTETQVSAWQIGSAANPFMVQLYGVHTWDNHLAVAMQLVPEAIPLSSHMGGLSVEDVKVVVLRLACICLMLHKAGVSHRGLSLTELLVPKSASSPIDFKLTPLVCSDSSPPGCEERGMQKDVHSLGEITEQLLGDRGDRNSAHLLRLLCAAPEKRCSMQDAVRHPWLAGSVDQQPEVESPEPCLPRHRSVLRNAVLEPLIISTGGHDGVRSRSHTWNSSSVQALPVDELAARGQASEVADPPKTTSRDSLARVLHTQQQQVMLDRGSSVTEVVVPIAEPASILHLEMQVEGKLRNHDVTVSLLLVLPTEPETILPVMGKRVVSSLSQKFIVQSAGEVRILLENRRNGWTKRKVRLSTLVRGPSTANLRARAISTSSAEQPLAVLKVQLLDLKGPLAQSESRVALSVDGSKPQVLEFGNSTDEWSTCSSCVLPIPQHSSVVLAALCGNKASVADPVGKSTAHGLIMVSQLLDRLSWRDLLSNQRSCLFLTSTLLLVPGPVETEAVLDEVQAMDAEGDATYLKLRVSFALMPDQDGVRDRLVGLLGYYAKPVEEESVETPQWASVLGPVRMLGDFKLGVTEQDFHSEVLRDHKTRLLKCAAATGELIGWLEGLAAWAEPRLSAVLLLGYLAFCCYGEVWQLPMIIAGSILAMGALNKTTLWRSRPDRSGQSLREKYAKYKGYLASAQKSLGQLVSGLERLLNLWHWQEKRASSVFAFFVMALASVLSAVLLVVHVLGVRLVGVCVGLALMRPPFLRRGSHDGQEHVSTNKRAGVVPMLKSCLWNLFLHIPDALEVTLRAACDARAQIRPLQPNDEQVQRTPPESRSNRRKST